MTLTFPYSSAPVRQIREIQFGVMSPEEIVSTPLLLVSSLLDPTCRICQMEGMQNRYMGCGCQGKGERTVMYLMAR